MFDEHGNYIEKDEKINEGAKVEDSNSTLDNDAVSDDNSGFLAEDRDVTQNKIADVDNNSNEDNYNQNNGYNNYNNNYNDGYNSNNNNYYGGYGNNSNANNNGYNGYNNYRGYYNAGNDYNNNNNNGKKSKLPIIITGIVAAGFFLVVGSVAISSLVTKEFGNKIASQNETTAATENETKEYTKVEKTDDSSYKDNTNKTDGKASVLITDVSSVVEDVMPSIVAITSSTKVEAYSNYDDIWSYFYGSGDGSGSGREYQETGAGSGIVVNQTDTELLIVTNNHVVEGADALSILFSDGKSVNGEVKATDETADIAIVAIPLKDIKESTLKAIKIARLGSSDDLNVGEGVIAIGNALGYGQSVTTGVISAKDRAIQVDDKEMIVLQTDAAINGGNSGGALLNSDGEVIGINVAKYSSSSYSGTASIEGMGFAIPISSATDIIENLMSKQTRQVVDEKDRGALGIEGRTIDSATAAVYGSPTGIIIDNVIKGAAADKAGIKTKDILVAFDDQRVSTIDALIEKMTYYKSGEKVEVKVSRLEDGEYVEKTIEVKLSGRQDLK